MFAKFNINNSMYDFLKSNKNNAKVFPVHYKNFFNCFDNLDLNLDVTLWIGNESRHAVSRLAILPFPHF